jgi:predicted metal-dependent phosphoesterase TrpH
MKKTLTLLSILVASASASAQSFYVDAKNPEMVHATETRDVHRKEIIIPQVNGYNVYKADLHTHTVYSDGQVLPKYRIREAWQDGIDIVAVTEHIEYRPNEAEMVTYLEKYTDKKHKEAVNHRLGADGTTKDGIMVDLNTAVKLSQQVAKSYGITIIPGLEITRDADKIGHLNALFTTDNNLVYDPDPYQSVLNAKAQGALVQHNHPGWRRTTLAYSEWQAKVYGEGLIDGVEVVNGEEIYPGIVDRCVENGLYITANTDIHASTASEYNTYGHDRPMTLIFAKDQSLESVREALEARRTLAFAHNNVWGPDQLLKDLFLACVKVENVSGRKYKLTNLSSIPYVIQPSGANRIHLDPMTTIFVSAPKGAEALGFVVVNMWNGASSNPKIEITVK